VFANKQPINFRVGRTRRLRLLDSGLKYQKQNKQTKKKTRETEFYVSSIFVHYIRVEGERRGQLLACERWIEVVDIFWLGRLHPDNTANSRGETFILVPKNTKSLRTLALTLGLSAQHCGASGQWAPSAQTDRHTIKLLTSP